MSYAVMFYNLENLYDTVDDPNTNDDDFTPTGEKRWTEDRYRLKLNNLSEVIATVAGSEGGFPVVIGCSEVENKKVMLDLAATRRLQGAHYKCVHYESNDARGVDVGAFYRADKFMLLGSEPVKLVLRSGREYIGRNILCMWGLLDGEMFAFYICHFMSRRTGIDTSAGFRRAGAETARDHAATLSRKYPGIKIIVMGDFNDNPDDASLADLLHARRNIHTVRSGEFFNPFWQLHDEGVGSSLFGSRWTMYDNIVASHTLLDAKHGLQIAKVDSTHYGLVFRRNFMMQKGKPKRCYNGNNFQSGYSDHLPVVIRLR